MPIGVIADAAAVVLGGILGLLVGRFFSDDFKENLNMIFGCCAMGMGISTIVLMENMPAVVFSLILGTSLGLVLHLGERINQLAVAMQGLVGRFIKNTSTLPQEEYNATFVTVLVLFCASGTGIYGAMVSGLEGDHTILFSKAILDLFTAAIFACSLGAAVTLIAVPQFAVLLVLFLLATVIYPMTTPAMIADFKACGGFLLLATGFRMIKVRMFPIADMIPAMILVMPISAFWVSVVLPLL